MMLGMVILMILFLVLVVLMVFLLVSKKIYFDLNKVSPFECGFIPRENSRGSFSNQFFLIALIFLIFDIELVLMFPFIVSFSVIEFFSFKLYCWFILILLMGFVFEWGQKALEWKK